MVDEWALERAAQDIGMNLDDPDQPRALWLVLAYMRAPMPSDWHEISRVEAAAAGGDALAAARAVERCILP